MGTRSYRLFELADIVGGELVGDGDVEICGGAGIKEAAPGDITLTRLFAVIGTDMPLSTV